MSRVAALLLAAGALCAALPVAAAPELRAWLGSAQYRADERWPDGRLFNAEHGRVRLAGAGLTLRLPQGGAALDLDITQARGALAYQGQTQLGVPLATRTRWHEDRATLLGRVTRPLPAAAGPGWQAAASLGLRSRSALRAIQPTAFTTPLDEQLDATEALAGLALHGRARLAGLNLGARAEWRLSRPLAQRLAVEAPGGFERVDLHPARRSGQLKSLQFAWYSESGPALHWTWSTETLRPGRSQGVLAFRGRVPVGEVTFPGSAQRLHGHTLQLAWPL